MKIVRLLLAVLLVNLASANILAQNDAEKEYFDLLMIYLDGDYEKLLKKADKYMESDKTRKDPLPYLYAAMGYFDIANNEELAANYKNPMRESLKLATKYARYDRKNEYEEEGGEFILKLKRAIKNEALEELKSGSESRASYYFKQLLRLDDADYSIVYMQMQMAIAEGDNYSAGEFKAEFKNMIALVTDWKKEPLDRLDFLTEAMLQHASFLVSKGRTDAAKGVMNELAKYVGPKAEIQEFKAANNL